MDGFWLPAGLRARVLADAGWETCWLKGGVIYPEEVAGAVAVRWPRLGPTGWRELLAGLRQNHAASGRDALARWQAVLAQARTRMISDSSAMIPTLAACTGYSQEMLLAALWEGDLASPRLLAEGLNYRPAWSTATRWERMPGLPGRVRFFPARRSDRATARLRHDSPLCRPAAATDLALGYAAGNVPGTALLIAFLAGAANLAHGEDILPPAVLIRNSRHEPLFTPWMLSTIEAFDPDLVAGLAVLIWDYEDEAIQRELMSRAGLMIAAAGDDTIAALDDQRAKCAPGLRFHRHGHKVSFAVIDDGASGIGRSQIALLSALDSSLWDQNGCLSARVHFVAGDADGYADTLAGQMRSLASTVPRGTTPRRFIHRAFDTFKALEGAAEVGVYSIYDDDFAVVVDRRPWTAETIGRVVNACMGRVIVVRPVEDVLEAPGYLRWLPARNLQSISVAMAADRMPEFAERAGACGATAIRSLGRAAFPQLAYSWDGLLPLDVACLRPEGHFTTVEFDDLQGELAETAGRWET